MSDEVSNLIATLAHDLTARRWQVATAESCTGGLIAAACTEMPGSSVWFDRGFVTYSNDAKSAMLDVSPTLIAEHGAVSEPVARAMAQGALQHSLADLAVAVTGIAGPGGGSVEKPVGTVWLAWAHRNGATAVACHCWSGDRAAVRQATLQQALRGLISLAATCA